MEVILVPIAIEIILMVLAAAMAIPAIKKELKILNQQFAAFNETQKALVETVIRDNEKLENHINDKHMHHQ